VLENFKIPRQHNLLRGIFVIIVAGFLSSPQAAVLPIELHQHLLDSRVTSSDKSSAPLVSLPTFLHLYPQHNMRILSIDPAIRNTGYAVIEGSSQRAQALCYGTISIPSKALQSQCLLEIHTKLNKLIEEWKPDALAIESIIYVQSHRTAIIMGSARGAAIISAAKHGLSITEYPPSCVKLATVGRGRADKSQVAFMVRAMLELTETPAPDAADALAIGLTHLAASDPLRSHLFEGRKEI